VLKNAVFQNIQGEPLKSIIKASIDTCKGCNESYKPHKPKGALARVAYCVECWDKKYNNKTKQEVV